MFSKRIRPLATVLNFMADMEHELKNIRMKQSKILAVGDLTIAYMSRFHLPRQV